MENTLIEATGFLRAMFVADMVLSKTSVNGATEVLCEVNYGSSIFTGKDGLDVQKNACYIAIAKIMYRF